ncbi:MAG: hypothetical protein KC414_14490 [Romboutsia sp.]|nr:hypothetical protein [Romboutsia sp.]
MFSIFLVSCSKSHDDEKNQSLDSKDPSKSEDSKKEEKMKEESSKQKRKPQKIGNVRRNTFD